ncbi:MAG: hypothetical protein A2X25_04465 [Chloroflexi bacterium GWB2_49_20]|nr:MAG: hypothetical protein A2X25_04465 [Chloroflexi bacterium GWB2_49_20]OGN78629.1 MAG: hypothetical protein A2X26_12525 [Chloroflexi bacterium GWC2_49_37]OGN85731.1 MAG: hypothetical protein A2X27_00995 [Chloroflexi bacterium GWD2_49_16]HBG75039.1 hypothetical protein [Anaerolineae bacterium]HCC78065.1 hypothetical protein [Anaerolineae bacterium]
MRRIVPILVLSIILIGCEPSSISNFGSTPTWKTPAHGVIDGSILPSVTPVFSQADTAKDIEVYFSDPLHRIEGEYRGGPDEYLVQAINAAKVSVDIAIYNIDLWSIRDALLDAFHRGLQVRIVMESDNLTDDVPQELKTAGIYILGDRREGLMHNKFVILDRQDVWTGSMNLTIGSAYYDNNNLIHLHSVELAEDYLTEFDEMFVRDMFGTDVVPETPHPQVMVGDILVEVYFSPDDGVAEHIVDLVSHAQESIYFMVYSFTSNDIGAAIIERDQAGIYVEGVMEAEQIKSNTGTEYDPFIQVGINVYKDVNSGLMHHKVIIIDHNIVITGSYNLSKNAETNNDENIVVIHSLEIAEKYLQEFDRVSAQAGQ